MKPFRHSLDEICQYKIYHLTSSEADMLWYMVQNDRPFFCIQEVVFELPYLDYCNFTNDTILSYRYHHQDVSMCFFIDGNFRVKWLGFVDGQSIHYLNNYDRLNRQWTGFSVKFRDQFRERG